MINKDKKRITITLSDSMYAELLWFSKDHKVTKSLTIEALLLAYFWENGILLEAIKNDKCKK